MSDSPGRDERRDGEPRAGETGPDEDTPEREPRTDRPGADAELEDDGEWTFSLSDLQEREEVDELVELRKADPEPEPVSLENAAFVLLGVAVCVVLLVVGFL